MERINADFRVFRANFDGFRPETNKIRKSNIKAFGRWLSFDADEIEMHGFDDWQDVLVETYQKLAFFRKYYCGQDLPDILVTGGMTGDFARSRERLEEYTHWQQQADDLKQWADMEAARDLG